MEVSHVSRSIDIKSHKGNYNVSFRVNGIDILNKEPPEEVVFIIDKTIVERYQSRLIKIIHTERLLIIEAKEENKSIEKLSGYINQLIALKIRRDQQLIAIGGGIIQDITCFLSSIMLRGLPWTFFPTTLLAQSDSCIGSKSSINCGNIKNILGTFYPPQSVIIDIGFLETLEKKDVLSGVGEMIKVHAIDSPSSFNRIASYYDQLLSDPKIMENFIYDSLLLKKKYIELDEFDKGPRNVMNYGHSFGHAIESATNYAIPHGIAVTIGMDLANFIAFKFEVSHPCHFERMHPLLQRNSNLYREIFIDRAVLLDVLAKDKKNSRTLLRLILPDQEGYIRIGLYENNDRLSKAISQYFDIYRTT